MEKQIQDESRQLLQPDYILPSEKRKMSRRRSVCWCSILLCWTLAVIGLIASGITVSILVKSKQSSQQPFSGVCGSSCMLSIVETIPENLTYPTGSPSHLSTYESWAWLLQAATTTVDIASYYWTLRGSGDTSDPTDKQGSDIYNDIVKAHSRGVKIRVVQNQPVGDYLDYDSSELSNLGVIELRNISVESLLGAGILHTKLWIVDEKHFYVGSANMDWRSLTQVKELGLFGRNCSCLVRDAQKIFEVYWQLSNSTSIPSVWPMALAAEFNESAPAYLQVNDTWTHVYWSSSPPKFCTAQRTDDITALLNVINRANKFIYIAVMDYEPAIIYTSTKRYWPDIDDALRRAAYERGIQVRLMASHWKHTEPDMLYFLRSLGSMNVTGSLGGSIETKFFVVPQLVNRTIPFTRVNHNKYMVTDNAAFIGTSNWSGDYFVSTGGVSCIVNQTSSSNNTLDTLQEQLMLIFERDWSSSYVVDVLEQC